MVLLENYNVTISLTQRDSELPTESLKVNVLIFCLFVIDRLALLNISGLTVKMDAP